MLGGIQAMNEELEMVKNRVKDAIDFADKATDDGAASLPDDFSLTLRLVAKNSGGNAALTVTVSITAADISLPF